MQACPYDALYIDPQTNTAAKCNYCAHRVDQGLEPACVNVCPTQAIISGDLDDPNSKIAQTKSRNQVTARKTEKGTKPALFYINGDVEALDPLQTPLNDETMWGKQVGGVGHWSSDHPEHALDRLGSLLNLGDATKMIATSSTALNSPVPENVGQKAENLLQSVAPSARRAYDAPQKGVLWGWQVSGYLWTKSIAAGICMLLLLSKFSNVYSDVVVEVTGFVLSLVFLGITGILLLWDLDQPKRFLSVLLRPQWRSWLVKGAYIITGFGALLTFFLVDRLLFYGNTTNALVAGDTPYSWLEFVVAIPLFVFAFLSAIYTAFLFAQAKGRDFWQSPMLPVQMLVHSVLAGGAILTLVYLITSGFPFVTTASFYCGIMVLCIVAHLVFTGFELGTTHPTSAAKKTVALITNGPYRNWFWYGVIFLGNVLPMAIFIDHWLDWIPGNIQSIAYGIGAVMVLAGVFIAQHVWVRAPQQIPLS